MDGIYQYSCIGNIRSITFKIFASLFIINNHVLNVNICSICLWNFKGKIISQCWALLLAMLQGFRSIGLNPLLPTYKPSTLVPNIFPYWLGRIWDPPDDHSRITPGSAGVPYCYWGFSHGKSSTVSPILTLGTTSPQRKKSFFLIIGLFATLKYTENSVLVPAKWCQLRAKKGYTDRGDRWLLPPGQLPCWTLGVDASSGQCPTPSQRPCLCSPAQCKVGPEAESCLFTLGLCMFSELGSKLSG